MGKKKKEAELEEAQAELEALADGNDLADDEPKEESKPAKKTKKKKKKEVVESDSEDEPEENEKVKVAPVKKSGFAAFQMDDSEEDHVVDSDEAPVIIKAPEPEPSKDKKKKKKKKKGGNEAKEEEEDELEKALAELNIEKKEDDGAKSAAQ